MKKHILLSLLSLAVSSSALADPRHARGRDDDRGHNGRYDRDDRDDRDDRFDRFDRGRRFDRRERFDRLGRVERFERFERMELAMPDAHFDALLYQLQRARFSQGRLGVLQSAATYNRFSVAQLRRIVQLMWFSGERLRAVEIIGPRLIDRQNAFMLDDAFHFGRERAEAHRILGC